MKDIKKRRSYFFWKDLLSLIQNTNDLEKVATRIFRIMDERRMFGSRTNAEYHWESMKFVLKELENPSKRKG